MISNAGSCGFFKGNQRGVGNDERDEETAWIEQEPRYQEPYVGSTLMPAIAAGMAVIAGVRAISARKRRGVAGTGSRDGDADQSRPSRRASEYAEEDSCAGR